MSYGKTITTYLVDGNATGIKTTELSNRIGKALIIPRAKLKDAKNRPEIEKPALYFLFGTDENGNDVAYIGEAENFIRRIGDHDTHKDFRDIVIAFVSKDNNLTKADVKYLEAKSIEKAIKAKRYILKNGVVPFINNLPEHQISTMDEFLENVDVLISAIGYPILKEMGGNINANTNENIYYVKGRGANAKGMYTEEGLLVLQGSRGPQSLVNSEINRKGYAFRNRPKLIEKGILKEEGEHIVFVENYIFSTPSGASDIILGRNTNGRKERKNSDGKTLDEIERQQLQ